MRVPEGTRFFMLNRDASGLAGARRRKIKTAHRRFFIYLATAAWVS
ncbi:MAG: hypothetical protein RLZZ463_1344, partial [Bacteroidota bacterium]